MGTRLIELNDGVNGYVDLVRHVMNHGVEVSPRGMKTVEIEDVVITINNPSDTLPLGVGRGTVPGIGAVEACQLLAGVTLPDLVVKVGPQFANYREDNGMFHGAYGVRTKGQYEKVIERLKADPDTRQAVVTIWNPELDLLSDKRDYPCTILHQFRIRDNKLNMTVFMRSNDVWLGAAYDFFQFTRVQFAIASVLGIEVGIYAHHVGSLHLYEQHYEAAGQLTYAQSYTAIPAIVGNSWEDVRFAARLAMYAAESSEYMQANNRVEWYANAMRTAIDNNSRKAIYGG